MAADAPFWKTKRLDQMTHEEWESLCDGCGRCCLQKLRRRDVGDVSWADVAFPLGSGPDAVCWSNVGCVLLDVHSCRCSDYPNRQARVSSCVTLTPENLAETSWVLPPSCAYRLVAEEQDLAWWHPLVSGDPATVHAAGVSVRGRAVPEAQQRLPALHVVDWPSRLPRGLRGRGSKRA